MTSPQSLVVSLEWAKKLQKAGWPGHWNSHFLWTNALRPDFNDPHAWWVSDKVHGACYEHLNAPTAEEVLRRLPRTLDEWNLDCLPNPDDSTWAVTYFSAVNVEQHTHPAIQDILPCEEATLADAAAKMYCYLASHNLLPPSHAA